MVWLIPDRLGAWMNIVARSNRSLFTVIRNPRARRGNQQTPHASVCEYASPQKWQIASRVPQPGGRERHVAQKLQLRSGKEYVFPGYNPPTDSQRLKNEVAK